MDNSSTTTSTSGTNVGTGNGTVTTTTGSATGSISLNSLAHLNATNFQVTVGSATAFFLYTDSTSKILQQPQIRALDGQKASLKLGERVPVATGSFQPGIGGVGINPLVNTQFNYIDVGVNVDITPRIHGLDEVTLKIAMDISAVDSYQNIGGIQQPVIGQRKIEQEIRLKEGEANIMGGILEETDTRNLQGIPGLAQIPFFRYLFSNDQKNRIDNELVFMLVPHIVRAQEISASNTKSIDVGTANVIQLHRPSILPETTQVINSPGGLRAQRRAAKRADAARATASRAAAGSSASAAEPVAGPVAGSSSAGQCDRELRSGEPESGDRLDLHRQRERGRSAEREFGSAASHLQPERASVAERLQWSIAGAGWAACGPGASGRRHGGDRAAHSFATAGGSRSVGQRFGLYADLPGEGRRASDLEHQSRSTEECRHANFAGQRVAGHCDRPLSGTSNQIEGSEVQLRSLSSSVLNGLE